MSAFIPRNLTEIEAVTGCTFACICSTVFCMFCCLQINCQPFRPRQLLKFYPFEWLIKIYLQTEDQGTQDKIISLQPMPGFSPLFYLDYSIPLNKGFVLALNSEIRLSKSNSSKLSVYCFLSVQN